MIRMVVTLEVSLQLIGWLKAEWAAPQKSVSVKAAEAVSKRTSRLRSPTARKAMNCAALKAVSHSASRPPAPREGHIDKLRLHRERRARADGRSDPIFHLDDC